MPPHRLVLPRLADSGDEVSLQRAVGSHQRHVEPVEATRGAEDTPGEGAGLAGHLLAVGLGERPQRRLDSAGQPCQYRLVVFKPPHHLDDGSDELRTQVLGHVVEPAVGAAPGLKVIGGGVEEQSQHHLPLVVRLEAAGDAPLQLQEGRIASHRLGWVHLRRQKVPRPGTAEVVVAQDIESAITHGRVEAAVHTRHVLAVPRRRVVEGNLHGLLHRPADLGIIRAPAIQTLFVVDDLQEVRAVGTFSVGHRSSNRQRGDHPQLCLIQVHRTTHHLAVILRHDPVHQLQVGVLDRVGGQFGGDLLGDEHPLTIGADLGEHIGEHLHRLPFDVGRLGFDLGGDTFEQPVGLLEDGHVLQPVARRAGLGL